ncbi:hypothetical protein FQZ97_634640 [compost metagenome]
MSAIQNHLESSGPCLASDVASWLESELGLTPDAARKRLSRAQPPIRSFPIALFPKGVRFLYVESQRTEERFWLALQRDLRSTGSVYGLALDGLIARQGAVRESNFAVISGATTTPVSRQVTAQTVLDRLHDAGLIDISYIGADRVVTLKPFELGFADIEGIKARDTAERIILDGLREWARNIGAASYNKIRIRGEPELEPIRQFAFDLAGPSYLLPLNGGSSKQPGFLVADVFSEGTLDEAQIRYFIRKAKALHATMGNASILPILVADSFTGEALTAGHAAGILMATPSTLFGKRVGEALRTLVSTLQRAAAFAASDKPDRLIGLVENLADIEGRAGNLRGPLFELVAAYLARRDAASIDMGVLARHPVSGEQADIDVLKFTAQGADCIAIECKGREPGGVVTAAEVSHWLKKLPVVLAYLRSLKHLREASISFEIWTTGLFTSDAIALLQREKHQRVKHPIDWKDGSAVLQLATARKEKAIANCLREHFLKHPLSTVAFD